MIVVRHVVSFSNLIKAWCEYFSRVEGHELTRAGQEEASNSSSLFRKYLEDNGLYNPIVGASVLLRAQQTAYLMMKSDPLFVVPYLSEAGPRFWFQTEDNKPFKTAAEKRQVLSLPGKKPSLETTLRPVPDPFPPKGELPDPQKLIGWIGNYYTTLKTIVLEKAPRFTNENQARYNELANMNSKIAQRMTRLQTGVGLRTNAIRANLRQRRNALRVQREALNRKRELATPLSLSSPPPLVLFTHGNFIAQFVQKVTGGRVKLAKEDRPNYSAFEFEVTLVPGREPTIVYRGRIVYDGDADTNPATPYTSSSKIDTAKECEEGGDRCRISACTRRSANVYAPGATRRRPSNLRAPAPSSNASLRLMVPEKPSVPSPPSLPSLTGNIGYYGEEEEEEQDLQQYGGRRQTRRRRVHFASKKTRQRRRA